MTGDFKKDIVPEQETEANLVEGELIEDDQLQSEQPAYIVLWLRHEGHNEACISHRLLRVTVRLVA